MKYTTKRLKTARSSRQYQFYQNTAGRGKLNCSAITFNQLYISICQSEPHVQHNEVTEFKPAAQLTISDESLMKPDQINNPQTSTYPWTMEWPNLQYTSNQLGDITY
jgi:hypothetical protein